MNDYKELIEKLCMAGRWIKHYDGSEETHLLSVADCEEAADAIEQLMRERDAAVADLKQNANCDFCKWIISGDCTDFEHEVCHGEHWEWRGVQE